ncbi:hypothetical protein FOL47_008167 [Perkinsus chesapeaki]|uniref:Uncharacterized protein n=1 Tax=Perkinsus chesapeaki TaxID=330153 RepID=A0A7J6MVF4_PERCH|nr:hypothetical protein FOL47_008167 [Perkinsus chesapeaki]
MGKFYQFLVRVLRSHGIFKSVYPMPKGNSSSSGKNGGKSNGGTATRGNGGSSRGGGKQESYGPSWLNKDGSVDPVEFAQREVGYFAPGHDHFDEKFNHACAMYGFKPWEMWSGNS